MAKKHTPMDQLLNDIYPDDVMARASALDRKRGIPCLDKSNVDRALLALQAVKISNEDPDHLLSDGVVDLLANLLHLCRIAGVDFKDAVRVATDHHDSEKAGD